MKKIIIKYCMSLWVVVSFCLSNISFWIAWWSSNNEPLWDVSNPYVKNYQSDEGKTTVQSQLKQETNQYNMLDDLLDIFNIWEDKYPWAPKFILYVKTIINIALWLLSFIALWMTIYTFYMMFFSDNEAGQKKAKWTLIWIFIAIAMIWIAWLIVSFIFWWYESNWKDATGMGYKNISYNHIENHQFTNEWYLFV